MPSPRASGSRSWKRPDVAVKATSRPAQLDHRARTAPGESTPIRPARDFPNRPHGDSKRDDVRILDVEHEPDVAQLLFARTVIDVMQQQDVERRQVLDAGRGHATDHPAIEGVAGDDQSELELGQFAALLRHQMRRRDEQLGRRGPSAPCAPALRFRQRLGGARSGLIDHERRRRRLLTWYLLMVSAFAT